MGRENLTSLSDLQQHYDPVRPDYIWRYHVYRFICSWYLFAFILSHFSPYYGHVLHAGKSKSLSIRSHFLSHPIQNLAKDQACSLYLSLQLDNRSDYLRGQCRIQHTSGTSLSALAADSRDQSYWNRHHYRHIVCDSTGR